MAKNNFVGPLQSEEKLKKLEEDYTVILHKIIRYIIEELGQSAEQKAISEEQNKFWRKYHTKISIPKAVALEMGYGDDRFVVVRGIANSKFHIYEEYEAEKDGTKQIFFLIEPKIISKPDKPNSNGKSELYYESISEEVKKYIRKLSKDEYEDLCEQIRIDGVIEVPITLPEGIHPPTLYKYFKQYKDKELFRNVAGFRRPHADSEARKQGYNLYVKVTGLDF